MLVLIVADSLSVRHALGRVLSARFEVVTARSGEEALRAATAPDLVIADVLMPGIGGFELCRRLRERDPNVPVILISDVRDAQIERQALAVGAATVIAKPFSPETLSAALEAALHPSALTVTEPTHDPDSLHAARSADVQNTGLQNIDIQNDELQSDKVRSDDLQRAGLPAGLPDTDTRTDVPADIPADTQVADAAPELLAALTRFLVAEVVAAMLSDRQGIAVAHVGERPTDAQVVANYSRFLFAASDTLGAHFGEEHVGSVMLEFPQATFYLGRVDAQHVLSLRLSAAEAFPGVRELVGKTRPDLAAKLRER